MTYPIIEITDTRRRFTKPKIETLSEHTTLSTESFTEILLKKADKGGTNVTSELLDTFFIFDLLPEPRKKEFVARVLRTTIIERIKLKLNVYLKRKG